MGWNNSGGRKPIEAANYEDKPRHTVKFDETTVIGYVLNGASRPYRLAVRTRGFQSRYAGSNPARVTKTRANPGSTPVQSTNKGCLWETERLSITKYAAYTSRARGETFTLTLTGSNPVRGTGAWHSPKTVRS